MEVETAIRLGITPQLGDLASVMPFGAFILYICFLMWKWQIISPDITYHLKIKERSFIFVHGSGMICTFSMWRKYKDEVISTIMCYGPFGLKMYFIHTEIINSILPEL